MMGEEDPLPGRLRVMQIIAFALPAGAVLFLAVAVLLVANGTTGQVPPDRLPLRTWMAVGFVALQAVLASIVPGLLMRSLVRQMAAGTWQPPPGSPPEAFDTDAAKLLAARQTGLIIGLAMLEGAAFFACVAYLVEARPVALAAAAVAIVLMLARFPTEQRVRTWLEHQEGRLAASGADGDSPAGL